MDVRNENFTVVGLGESGLKAALLLNKEGAIVRVTDACDNEDIRRNGGILKDKYIDIEIGRHTQSFLEGTEIMVASPGVENDALPLRYANEHEIPVISELELGYYFCEAPIIAITGTNGKSTVTELTGSIFKNAGKKAIVCGNIGNAFCGEISRIDAKSIVVLEVSSFQLERCYEFRPKISCILNITEDHLSRYPSFAAYFRAKQRIFSNQLSGDFLILNFDDENLGSLEGKYRFKKLYYSTRHQVEGIYLSEGRAVYSARLRAGDEKKYLFDISSVKLKGEHNIGNILASALIALLNGIDADIIAKTVNEFETLEHRLQTVAFIGGVEFIDDSKGTNIDATKKALEAFHAPVILIAGGRDKGGDYNYARVEIKNKVKRLILIGEAKDKIAKAFGNLVEAENCDSLEEAVRVAFSSAKGGDKVLLSPMCSSFDMFKDYKHRGEVFREAVKELGKGK